MFIGAFLIRRIAQAISDGYTLKYGTDFTIIEHLFARLLKRTYDATCLSLVTIRTLA